MSVTVRPMKWMIAALATATVALGVQQGRAEQAAPAPAVPPAAAPALSQDDIDAAVLDRQLVMQQLEKDSLAVLAPFLRQAPANTAIPRLKAFAKTGRDAIKSFEIKAPGGSTKPEAWAEYDKFMALMADMVKKTDDLVKVAETRGNSAVFPVVGDAVSGPCKACHDVYRFKKEKPAT